MSARETAPQSRQGSDDDTAVAAARRGDLRAWEWIARRYQELVFRSAYLTTRDSSVAEEVTIDVLARAYRALDSLGNGRDLRAWLLRLTDTTARNRTRELSRRRNERMVERAPTPRIPASQMRLGAGAPRLTAAEHAALVEAFDGLMDEDRTTLAARYAFWLDRDAAAERLSVKPRSVDERLAEATSHLRRRVREVMSAAHGLDPRGVAGPSAVSRMGAFSDDQLGALTLAAVLSELPWSPDIALLTCDRLAREAVAYPATPTLATPDDGRALGGGTADPLSPASRRRGPGVMRSASVLVGISLVGASLVISSGVPAVRGWDLPAEVRSHFAAFLGEPAIPATASVETVPEEVAAEPAPNPAVSTEVSSAVSPALSYGVSTAASVGPVEAVEPSATAGLDVSVVGVRRLDRGVFKAVVRLDWLAGEHDSASRLRLEQSLDGGDWTAGAWLEPGEQVLAVIRPDQWYDFRVRADAADGVASAVTQVQLTARGPLSASIYTSDGDWELRRGPEGGKRLVALEGGALLRTQFEGGNVALVGREHVTKDAVDMRIDGGAWDTDPAAGQRLGRWVLFSQKVEDGPHALEVRAPVNGLGIDAVFILRSRQA